MLVKCFAVTYYINDVENDHHKKHVNRFNYKSVKNSYTATCMYIHIDIHTYINTVYYVFNVYVITHEMHLIHDCGALNSIHTF